MSTQPQAMLNGRPLLGWNDPDAKPVDPNERPRFLRELLEKEEWQYQRTNILKVLDIYKSGKEFAPGERIWLVDGEVVSGLEEAVSKGGVKWLECTMCQFMNQAQRYPLPLVPAAQWCSQPWQACQFGRFPQFPAHHMIFIQVRLPTPLGGNDNLFVTLPTLNDTGSSAQTLFRNDLRQMGFIETPATFYPGSYSQGILGSIPITTANGTVRRMALITENRVVKPDGTPMTGWYWEIAIVDDYPAPATTRLSGENLRTQLYLATAPGNHGLFASQKRGGITRLLPTV